MIRRDDYGHENPLEEQDNQDFLKEEGRNERKRSLLSSTNTPGTGFQDFEETIDVMFADWTDTLYEVVQELQLEYPEISVVAMASDASSVLEYTRQLFPDVIVLSHNLPGMSTVSLIQALVKEYPQIPIIVMIDEEEVDAINRLIHSGAKDTFIRQDFTLEELASIIRKVYRDELRRREEERLAKRRQAEVEREIRRRRAASRGSEKIEVVREKQQVISFYSPKGGLGTTTLAINTALVLGRMARARNDNLKVILVDCDFGYGNIGDGLLIPNRTNIYDVIQTFDEKRQMFDPHALDKAIVQYDNIDVLLAPNRLEFNDLIEDVHIRTLIQALKEDKGYDVIILDTTTHLSDTTIAALRASNKIFFLLSQDLPTIRIAQQVIELLTGRLDISPSTIRLVLSQIIQGVGVAPGDIRDYLNFPIVVTTPEDRRLVMNSYNNGKPIAASQNTPLLSSIKRIAGMISPALGRHMSVEETSSKPSGGLFASLFSSGDKTKPVKKKKTKARKVARGGTQK